MRGVGVDLDHRVAQRDRRAVPRRVGAVAQPSLGEVVAPLAVEELRDRLGQRTVGDARGHQALGRAARVLQALAPVNGFRSEEHTSELQSLMRISYAVFCLKKKNKKKSI